MATVVTSPAAVAGGSFRPLQLGLRVLKAGPALILGALLIAFSLASPYFLTHHNLQNLGAQSAIVGALGLGEFLVILVRGIDVSVASVIALSGVVAATVAGTAHANGLEQLALFLAVGLAFGLVNAVIIIKGRIAQPLIVTVATLGIGAGLALIISGGNTYTGVSGLVSEAGDGIWLGLPASFVLVTLLALILWVIARRTQYGRWLYAAGGDPVAAERLGLPVGRLVMSCYIICGVTAGFAGLLYAGQTASASPLAGAGYELQAITAVIIGGASLFGGRGSVLNVLLGALILGTITNGLDLVGVSSFWSEVAVGVVILFALELDVLRKVLETRLQNRQARQLQ